MAELSHPMVVFPQPFQAIRSRALQTLLPVLQTLLPSIMAAPWKLSQKLSQKLKLWSSGMMWLNASLLVLFLAWFRKQLRNQLWYQLWYRLCNRLGNLASQPTFSSMVRVMSRAKFCQLFQGFPAKVFWLIVIGAFKMESWSTQQQAPVVVPPRRRMPEVVPPRHIMPDRPIPQLALSYGPMHFAQVRLPTPQILPLQPKMKSRPKPSAKPTSS